MLKQNHLRAVMLLGFLLVWQPEPEATAVLVGSPPKPDPVRVDAHRLAWVEAIEAETLIEDRELAEIVAQAVEDAACEFDVNPWLVASLIRIESGGRPSVVSHAGAIGLTQILPGTAEEIAQELGIEEYDLEDPAQNVRMGTFYLSYLLERFDGDEKAALAAYNWGPTTIARRIGNSEPLPTVYPTKILSRLP